MKQVPDFIGRKFLLIVSYISGTLVKQERHFACACAGHAYVRHIILFFFMDKHISLKIILVESKRKERKHQ